MSFILHPALKGSCEVDVVPNQGPELSFKMLKNRPKTKPFSVDIPDVTGPSSQSLSDYIKHIHTI